MTLTRICLDCLDILCVLRVCPLNSTYFTAHLTFAQRQALVCVVVLLLMWDVDAGIFKGMRARFARARAAEGAADADMGPEKSELVVKVI